VDDRLTELEVKMTHQERQIADLSEMVSEQWKLIQKLGTLLSKADARIESLENNSSTGNQFDEKPPHY
jgi:SlyX protein